MKFVSPQVFKNQPTKEGELRKICNMFKNERRDKYVKNFDLGAWRKIPDGNVGLAISSAQVVNIQTL